MAGLNRWAIHAVDFFMMDLDQNGVDDNRLPRITFVVQAFVWTAMVVTLALWSCQIARDDSATSPLIIAFVVFFIAGAGVGVFTIELRKAWIHNPNREVFRLAPLSQRQLFWWVWRQTLVTAAPSLGLCGPAWGWLFGRDAPLWLYPATAIVLILGILACAAVAAVLVQIGEIPSLLAIAVPMAVGPILVTELAPKAITDFSWHPVMAMIPALLAGIVVCLGLADLLVRCTFAAITK